MVRRDSFSLISRDIADAERALAAYGMGVQRADIEQLGAARGFSGARIFLVKTPQGDHCLRRWPKSGLPQQRLRELHHFLSHLQSSGIDEVAVPIDSERGETLVDVDGQLWQLEPWMPGAADFNLHPTEGRLQSAMRVLARLHLAAERYECWPSGIDWFGCHTAAPSPACVERIKIIHSWDDTRCETTAERLKSCATSEFRDVASEILSLFRVARQPILAELRSQKEVRFRLHPCLRDVWHDHVLFTDETVTGLIDPAATRTENVASDLSRLLGSLLGDDPRRWEDALEIYCSVRPLSEAESRLVRTLDRSSVLLSGLTWIERGLNRPLSENEGSRVVRRMQTIVKRLNVLVEEL